MFKRTRIRLTAWYVGALALFLLALCVAVFQLEERQLRTNVDRGLRVTAERVQVRVDRFGVQNALDSDYGTSYTVAWTDGSSGVPEGNSNGTPPANRTSALAAIHHGTDLRTIERNNVTTRIYSVRLKHANLVVQVARSPSSCSRCVWRSSSSRSGSCARTSTAACG